MFCVKCVLARESFGTKEREIYVSVFLQRESYQHILAFENSIRISSFISLTPKLHGLNIVHRILIQLIIQHYSLSR